MALLDLLSFTLYKDIFRITFGQLFYPFWKLTGTNGFASLWREVIFTQARQKFPSILMVHNLHRLGNFIATHLCLWASTIHYL